MALSKGHEDMGSRVRVLITVLLLAVPLQAKEKLNITVEMDPSLAEKEGAVWIGYLMARANYVSKHESDYGGQAGLIVPTYDEELSARSTATQIYRELKAADSKLAIGYFEDLVRIDNAGFLPEYVWVYLHQDTWKTAPEPERLKLFDEWRSSQLTDHKSQTHGRLLIGEPSKKK